MTPVAVADTVAAAARDVLGQDLPIRVRGWDGSETGPRDAPSVVLSSPAALRRLLWAPSELGLARAYVTGDLDVDGDLDDALRRIWAIASNRAGRRHLRPGAVVRGMRAVARLGGLGLPPRRPESEARPRGRLHSKRRDAQVISHHYDLSNALYALLLDEHLAYSCGYWTRDGGGYDVTAAQRDKLDLICRKLDLHAGTRLLDVGCGWGALAVHAAKHFGAHVTGVTISAEQLTFGRARLTAEGVADLVDLRLQDCRDVTADTYDAVAAIEMGEHVGKHNYPAFLRQLYRLARPGGRVLIQQMSRGVRYPGGGPFIERYIARDMHMRPLPETLALVETAGLEVRDVQVMREHYVRTIKAWLATFEDRFDDVVDLVGAEQARVWRLYLVGGAMAFEHNRMGVDQILAVRTQTSGASGMPATRAGWEPSVLQQSAPAPAWSRA